MIRKRNKRGSLQDIMLVGIILLFFGVVVLLGFKVSNEFDEQIQSNDLIPANAKTASTSLVGNYTGSINNMFLFLTVGLAIVTLILAALVRVHPIFIPLFFIALVFVIFISGILSNIYQEMADNPNLETEADQLTFITNILTYLPFFVGIFGILLMVILYKVGQPFAA